MHGSDKAMRLEQGMRQDQLCPARSDVQGLFVGIYAGEGKLAGSATGSYGTYGLGTYGYAAQQTSLASYARAPRDTAALGLAYSPVTQPAPPAYYAGAPNTSSREDVD